MTRRAANNHQLHPDEKTLAKKLAANSNGKWTATQIEEQMRGMSMTKNGVTEAGSPDTIVGTQLGDGKWMKAGTTADGQPIFTQQIAPADAELRAYIVGSTTNSAVPSLITYTGSSDYAAPSTSNILPIPTAACGSGDMYCASGTQRPMTQAQLDAQRNQGADFFEAVSTQAGRFGAAATAYGTLLASSPNPHTAAGATIQFGLAGAATIVGFGTGVMEQLLRPNAAQLATGSLVDIFNTGLGSKFPLAGPAINEAAETLKSSTPADNAADKLNNVLGVKK